MDFVSDALFDGRKFRVLTVVDNHTRECLAIEVAQSLTGDDVVRVTCLVFSSQSHLETPAPVIDSDFHCDTNSNGVLYFRLEWG